MSGEYNQKIASQKEEKLKLVEEFYREFGRLPKQQEVYNEIAIGLFLNNIRRGDTRITEEQLKRLEVLGFNINIKDKEEEKMRKIKLIEEFYKEYKRLPKTTEKYKEVALGTFLHHIRQGNTKISEDQMTRLKKIGFQGQINDMRVEKSIQKIEQFYEETGRIPMLNENLGKKKVGEMLVQIRIGKVRITESQFLRLQKMDATLTREQVRFFEKTKTYVKKG